MFNKPISQLNLEDIQILIDNQEKESLILEYKQELTGNDKEKKEISKDVSAIANTCGGYLIIGIEEEDGKAASISGTQGKIGRQPVEEWIESVLISNVRPRLTITPKIISIEADRDKVVVVIHIPQSTRRPHMVTIGGKNAYYRRHNYQATYADEHEVRSMFLENKSSSDEMNIFLNTRNLIDSSKDNFAITPLSSLLLKSLRETRELPEGFSGDPFVLFSACPRYLEERVDIASTDFRSWLDENDKINLFDLDIDFLDYNKVISADSIRSLTEVQSEKREDRLPYRYVEIFRNGYIENGISNELMWSNNKMGLMFQIAYFTASFWLFMKFIKNMYEHIEYIDEVNLIVALSDIDNVTLHGFGNKNENTKWANPYDVFHTSNIPTCKQKNVKIERNIVIAELNDEYIEEIVKEVSRRVSNAFGESIAKCFDDQGVFNRDQLRGFRNVQ
ncbi:MAG: ATP-binding protein [Candidatus Pacebacteria bacterium]|nr:ATP-binding protein [Candidatus Paceibacterota bacterium]